MSCSFYLQDMFYEWTLPEDAIKPKDNPIIGHIVARLLTLMNPPTVSNFRFISKNYFYIIHAFVLLWQPLYSMTTTYT